MSECTRDEFLAGLRQGDIGLILAKNTFSSLQNLLRKKENVPLRASHAFLVDIPPGIIEANGIYVSRDRIGKFVGATTQCWIFRHSKITETQRAIMSSFGAGMIEAHGHYSIGGIVQFGLLYFFGKRLKVGDNPGVFCSELTGKALLQAKLPYITNEPPFLVTPSDQRSWFEGEGLKMGYTRPLWYQDGKYFKA